MAPGRLVAGGCDQAPYKRESRKDSPSSSSDTLKFCKKAGLLDWYACSQASRACCEERVHDPGRYATRPTMTRRMAS